MLLCEAAAFRAYVEGLVQPTGAARTRQRAFEAALARRAVADPPRRRTSGINKTARTRQIYE